MSNGQKCGITRNGPGFHQNMIQNVCKTMLEHCLNSHVLTFVKFILVCVCICTFCEINHNKLADVAFLDATM